MQLAPHLHRLGNDVIASYLIDLPDGITLVDTGLPGHWTDLLRELRTLGRSLDDIRGAILTHGDSDHLGFAERLRRATGTPIFIHSADAHRARTGDKPPTPTGPARVGPTLQFLTYSLRKRAFPVRYVQEVVEVADGDVLDLPGRPRILGMPGHSPGSIAVHVAEVDAVFVGDALTTRHVLTGKAGPQPAPFTDEPELATASLKNLAQVAASWVLPGHGAPWRGTPAALVAAMSAAA
ncbi:MBL fold metallo-hydrolase [Sanguibacter sp. A247]|uniref:MBL fold metallo-hydrolase n=1 Tax=unclassified Sanguibacter TaxID=2645534 RepID=UPI003FD89199